MDDQVEPLPIEGKIELGRRMAVASGVTEGIKAVVPLLADAEAQWAKFSRSKSKWLLPTLTVIFFLFGNEQQGYFFAAIGTLILYIGRGLTEIALKKERGDLYTRLRDLKVMWLAAGHYQESFDELVILAKRENSLLDSNDREYDKWVTGLSEEAENALRIRLGLTLVFGTYERHQQFYERLQQMQESNGR